METRRSEEENRGREEFIPYPTPRIYLLRDFPGLFLELLIAPSAPSLQTEEIRLSIQDFN